MAPPTATGDTREPTTRDRVEAAFVRAAFALFGALPRGAGLRLGAWIGELFYRFDARNRTVAIKNLRLAFPDRSDAELHEIARRSCRNLGRLIAEVAHFDELNADNVERFFTVDDPERWRSCLDRAAETGAIVLTAHFGNFELLAYSQGLLGHPVTLAHRTMRNPLVDRMILDMRAPAGTRSMPKKSAARILIRALRQKQLIALLADQNQTASAGIFASLFGVPACTTPGPARLAMHTGAPIVPVFLVREGETDHHRLVIYPDVEVADTGDKLADMVETTERCNRVIERALTEYPDQWIWFHKRWKTRPPGEPKFY